MLLVKLKHKVVWVINNVLLCDHIKPNYVNLSLIKLPDIVKLNTCQLFYDHFADKKPYNFMLVLVSEQHNYDTRSTSLQYLNPSSFRINIRKFHPTDIPYIYVTRQAKNCLKEHYTIIILLSINHRATQTLKCLYIHIHIYLYMLLEKKQQINYNCIPWGCSCSFIRSIFVKVCSIFVKQCSMHMSRVKYMLLRKKQRIN